MANEPTFSSLLEDDVQLEFDGQDSSFPPSTEYNNTSNFEDSIGGGGEGTDTELSFRDEEGDQALLIDQVPNHSFWSMDYYRVFFDVGTKTVLSRLARSLLPVGGRAFYSKTEVPDLYGPFWVITTLIVVLAISGNFASYIHFLPSDKHIVWQYDFEKVTVAASVFYTMITAIPLCVWLYLKKGLGVTGSTPWLAHIISIYGYSFTVFIPAAFICIFPSELGRWTTVLITYAVSGIFVIRNIWSYMPTNNADWSTKTKTKGSVLIIAIAILHFGVALATKFYFFHYISDNLPPLVAPTAATAAKTVAPALAPSAASAVPALAPAAAAVAPTAAAVAPTAAAVAKTVPTAAAAIVKNGTRLLF